MGMTRAQIAAGQLIAAVRQAGLTMQQSCDGSGKPVAYRMLKGNRVAFELEVDGLAPREFAAEMFTLIWTELECHPCATLCVIPAGLRALRSQGECEQSPA